MILALVQDGGITSQERLRALLAARGHGVTQATVSRDLASLGLVRVAGEWRTTAAMATARRLARDLLAGLLDELDDA